MRVVFTDGAYIHGVPVNAPRKTQIEYSPSLGTTPRSHMCVRNATSHAKFIYDWAPVNELLFCIGINVEQTYTTIPESLLPIVQSITRKVLFYKVRTCFSLGEKLLSPYLKL